MLGAVTIYLPLFYVITSLLLPVAPALIVRRLDLRFGLASLVPAGAVFFLLSGGDPYLPVMLVLQTGLLGILLGLIFKNNVPSGRAIVIVMGFSLIAAAGTLYANYIVSGANPFVLNQVYREFFDLERQYIDELASGGDTAVVFDPDVAREMVSRLEAAWPVLSTAAAIIWYMISGFITYWLTRRFISRGGYSVPPPIPFSRWKLPWYAIWGVIAGLLIMLAGNWHNNTGLENAGKVVLWVMGFVFLVLGISVSDFYLRRWKVSRPMKILIVVVAGFFLHLAVIALIALGTTDAVANMRRLSKDGRVPEEGDKK